MFIRGFIVILQCFSACLGQRLCAQQPPTNRDPRECCRTIPQLIDQMIYAQCIQRYGDNTQRQLQELQPNSLPKGNCVADCAANASSIKNNNGMIDRIKLTRLYMNAVSGDRVWSNIMSQSIDICFNETSKKADELRAVAALRTTFPGEILCHPQSGFMLGCLDTELFKRCPSLTQTSDCLLLRDYSQNCFLTPRYILQG